MVYSSTCARGSSVGIATDYGLNGTESNPGGDEIFFPSRPPLGPTQPSVKWVQVLSRGLSAAGKCCRPLTQFLCRGHGRVELYLYPLSGPHWACNGITLLIKIITRSLSSRQANCVNRNEGNLHYSWTMRV